ncbi:MAG: hypothetical protein GC160_28720 [Acidobacteria bacterium]|nr:hypothetical protein [Acidobacteriota bacterium]
MGPADSITSLPTASPAEVKRPTTVREAAAQFEAMLTKQMLAAARAAGEPLAEEREQTAESYLEFAESVLSEALARSGGLGFAQMTIEELKKSPDAADKS